MGEADAVIIGTPTYFANVTTEGKALVDRAGMVGRVNKFCFKNKIGAPVVAVRRGGMVPAYDAVNRLFQINGMIVPSSIIGILLVDFSRERLRMIEKA